MPYLFSVDTYRTQDFADDPPTPHISVHSPPDAHHRHSIVCTPPNSLPYLSDGNVYTLELLYDGSTRRLIGYLSSESGQRAGGNEISLFDTSVPVGTGEDWYVGITGSCGGLWQRVSLGGPRYSLSQLVVQQEVLEWSVDEIELEVESEVAPSEPMVLDMPDTGGT